MNPKALFLLLAGLVAGGLIGRWTAPPTAADDSPTSIESRWGEDIRSQGPPESDGSILAVPDRRSEDRTAVVPQPNLPAVIPAGVIDDALASVPASGEFETQGTGFLEGQVVDSQGRGIEGVELRILSRAPSGQSAPRLRSSSIQRSENPRDTDLRERLERTAESWALGRAKEAVARTDEAGEFRVEGLDEEKSYFVYAYHDDYQIKPQLSASYGSGDRAELVAQRIVEVVFAVVDDAGRPVDEAHLVIDAGRSVELALWSPISRAFELVEGEVEVRALVGAPLEGRRWDLEELHRDAAQYSELLEVDVAAGMDEVVLQLDVPDALEVVVVPSSELPEEFGASVVLEASRGSGTGRSALRHSPFTQGRSKSIDREALSARFGGLAPGIYDVRVTAGGEGAPLVEGTVEFRGGSGRFELVLPPVVAVPATYVRVLAPDGTPVESCRFSRKKVNGGSTRTTSIGASRMDDGRYRVSLETRLREVGAPGLHDSNGSIFVLVSHSEHGSLEVPILPGTYDYVAQYEPRAVLDVTVDGWDAISMNGASVGVRAIGRGSDDGGPRQRRSHRSSGFDLDGNARVEGLTPGAYGISLVVGGQTWAHSEVTVFAGENATVLNLEPRYSFAINAPGLDPGTDFHLSARHDSRGWGGAVMVTLDDQRRAVFENVIAGTYTLISDVHTQEIVVPTGDITIDARLPNALRVAIFEEDGLLAQLGFEDGDVVFGIDGAAFEGMDDLRDAMHDLGAEELVLMVERDGAVIDLATGTTSSNPLNGLEMGGSVGLVSRE